LSPNEKDPWLSHVRGFAQGGSDILMDEAPKKLPTGVNWWAFFVYREWQMK
jgi:hypothetical protein